MGMAPPFRPVVWPTTVRSMTIQPVAAPNSMSTDNDRGPPPLQASWDNLACAGQDAGAQPCIRRPSRSWHSELYPTQGTTGPAVRLDQYCAILSSLLCGPLALLILGTPWRNDEQPSRRIEPNSSPQVSQVSGKKIMGCASRRRKNRIKENSLTEISSANVNGLDLRLPQLGMAVWAKGKWVLSCKEIGCWMRIYPLSNFCNFLFPCFLGQSSNPAAPIGGPAGLILKCHSG